MSKNVNKLCAKEEVLHEELSNIDVQLTALGQRLIDLGHYLKDNPAKIMLTNCDINNPNSECDFTFDFKELQECPELIKNLLKSFHELHKQLKQISDITNDQC